MPTLIIAGDAATGLVQSAASDGALTIQSGPAGSKVNAINFSSTGAITDKDGNTINSPIGVGQTWQDVSASRTSGTTYTNSTGKPIMVMLGATAVSGTPNLTVTVGGVQIINFGFPYGTSNPASFIVPNNTTYVCTFGTGTGIGKWVELR